MGGLAAYIDSVRTYINSRVARHAVHAGNVTNIDTPNYKARVPNFSAVLDRSVQQPDQSPWKTQMKVTESQQPIREDGNNVQLELEMAAIAENSMQYASAIKLLSKQMGLVRYAVTSGG